MWIGTTGYSKEDRSGSNPRVKNSQNNKQHLYRKYFALHVAYDVNAFLHFVLSCISDASLFYHPGSFAMYCIRVPSTGWVTEAVPRSSCSKGKHFYLTCSHSV